MNPRNVERACNYVGRERPCIRNPTLKAHSNSNIIQQVKAETRKALGISYRNEAKQNIFHNGVFYVFTFAHVHTNPSTTTWYDYVIGTFGSHKSRANWEQHILCCDFDEGLLVFRTHQNNHRRMFHVFWHCSANEIKPARTAAHFCMSMVAYPY